MKKALQTLFFLLLTVVAVIGQDLIDNANGKLNNNKVHHHRLPNITFQRATHLKSSHTIKQRLDSTVFRAWNDTTKLWTNYSKRVNTYDNNEKNTQSIGYVWVKVTGTWIPDWKSEISYNEKQNASQCLTYDWNKATGQWIPDWKEVFSYNSNGTIPQILDYDWDQNASQWVLSWQYIYSYNANGHLTQVLDYYQDETTLKWVLAWKYIYSFDANGNQTQQLEYFLDENTSEWVADSKIEYIYDENGNMSEYLVYNRNQANDQLELDWKRDYSYDINYSFNDLISPFLYLWQVNYFHHKMTGQSTSMWNKNTSTWDHPIYNTTYYYSELNTTSANSLNLKLPKIYPNPASEYIQFEFTGSNRQAILELFDFQGRKILSVNVLSGEKLDIQQLNKGVYFYNIITSENRQSGKLIKQ